MKFSENYNKAIIEIDEAYQQNKETIEFNLQTYPKEYLYALRMVDGLQGYKADASEKEYLAARCQHLFRWEIPRNTYPMDRKGYHQWRTFLYAYQANKTGLLLNKVGYNNNEIDSIKDMIEKKDLRTNPSSQLIEDVACFVFLQYYLDGFIEQHKNDEAKLKRIISSTWQKMSNRGREEALKLKLSSGIIDIITSL